MNFAQLIAIAIYSAILFLAFDNKILEFFQKISDRIVKKTGYNNYEIASIIMWLGITVYTFVNIIFSAKDSTDVLIILFFDAITFVAAKLSIKKGKKAYETEGDIIRKKPETLEFWRLSFFAWAMGDVHSTIFRTNEMSKEILFYELLLLIVVYFSSCMPLPRVREKFKLWKWTLGKVKTALNPAPEWTPAK